MGFSAVPAVFVVHIYIYCMIFYIIRMNYYIVGINYYNIWTKLLIVVMGLFIVWSM